MIRASFPGWNFMLMWHRCLNWLVSTMPTTEVAESSPTLDSRRAAPGAPPAPTGDPEGDAEPWSAATGFEVLRTHRNLGCASCFAWMQLSSSSIRCAGKSVKSTRMLWSCLSLWKESSVTSSECRKKLSFSLVS